MISKKQLNSFYNSGGPHQGRRFLCAPSMFDSLEVRVQAQATPIDNYFLLRYILIRFQFRFQT